MAKEIHQESVGKTPSICKIITSKQDLFSKKKIQKFEYFAPNWRANPKDLAILFKCHLAYWHAKVGTSVVNIEL